MNITLEKDPSGRATCQICLNKISKGDTRVRAGTGWSTGSVHLRCLMDRFSPPNLENHDLKMLSDDLLVKEHEQLRDWVESLMSLGDYERFNRLLEIERELTLREGV